MLTGMFEGDGSIEGRMFDRRRGEMVLCRDRLSRMRLFFVLEILLWKTMSRNR